jgi:hypothetical protein
MSLTKALRVDTVGFPQRVPLDDIAMTREDGTPSVSCHIFTEQMGSENGGCITQTYYFYMAMGQYL